VFEEVAARYVPSVFSGSSSPLKDPSLSAALPEVSSTGDGDRVGAGLEAALGTAEWIRLGTAEATQLGMAEATGLGMERLGAIERVGALSVRVFLETRAL
jgi:hypothetical protein